ncbi:MAG TPA: DUF1566 domain-containing protein [Telluria sp.]|jgi:hypothetical protein
MTTVSLQEIKVAHHKVSEMIAAFEAQVTREVSIPMCEIRLKDGEYYAGLITGPDGNPTHHLVLLPGDAEGVNWEVAKKFAADLGGDLPTRREQALLFANLKDQFEERWYWSCEQHAAYSDYAWGQYFDIGYQNYDFKSYEGRARAVRRLAI